MRPIAINKVLESLDFNDQSSQSTLFFTAKEYKPEEIFFEERLILETAKILQAAAVFFRRFGENQSSQPQLFIFDNIQDTVSVDELAEIHRKIWSSGIVPLYYVIDKTSINIYDARKHVDYDKNFQKISVKPFEIIPIAKEAHIEYQKYSAKLFTNGTFWEQKEVQDRFLSKGSSENKLIEELKNVRSHFIKESGLKSSLAHQLLVLSILVKYLEERKDEEGKHVFPSDYFYKYNKATSFCEVLRAKKVVDLFDDLSKHFNGKIFEMSAADKIILSKTDLSLLANYLDAKVDNGQLVLWPLYSFEYLPVELISRIYEEFVDQREDAVFTPIHLARLMVDECMPIATPQQDFKVIDVSCGSGIFLVTVFKRLVQWWQKEQFQKTGKLVFPKTDDLKTILRNSIYGVDIEEASVRLSVFSLSIALCDMLKPTEIWTDLRFDDLRERNIHHKDFFQYLSEAESGQFSLVIGNPPFEDKRKDFKKYLSSFNITPEYTIPRNQMAMLFLQQAMKLLKPGGLLSLVMPSGPLLYNNTLEFRKEFFSRYTVPQIIDLSELRNATVLFEKTVATAVVFAYNREPDPDHTLQHITVKRSKSTKERLFFEIDHYDIHPVSQEVAETDLAIWKANLMGGNQLYYLIKRLRQLQTLGEFLENKKRSDRWAYGEGYHYGDRKKQAAHLTGKLLVESNKFTERGILETKIESSTLFGRTREDNKLIFKAPHLLIKEIIGKKKFISEYVDFDLIFKNRIVGIHAPTKEKDQLLQIQHSLLRNYSIFKLLILSLSAEAGINRSGGYVMYMKDILNLPFPKNDKDLLLSTNEEIIKDDVLIYKLEELSKGEKAKINIQSATDEDLEEFGAVFCQNLNSIYQTGDKKFKTLQPIKTLSYTCYPFAFGTEEFAPELSGALREGDLSELIENQHESVHYRRILRLYQKDLIFLIKPNTLRYWLKSIALRDAGDVMNDFVNSGY